MGILYHFNLKQDLTMTATDISEALREALKLDKYKLCGVCFSNEKPANALELKKKGSGCIVPLILKASTGVPLVVSEITAKLRRCGSFSNHGYLFLRIK